MKIVFAPAALEQLEDMDPAEAQEFMDMIQAAIDDGSLFTESEPVDFAELEREEPEVYARLMDSIESMPVESDGIRTLH